MKILEIIASVDPRGGGPIEGVFQQARARKLAHLADTHVASLDAPDAPWVRDCPLKVFPLGLGASESSLFARLSPLRRYGYAPRFVPWLRTRASDYDVIIVNGLWNYAAFGAKSALAGSGRPYVVFTHGMLDPWFRRTYPLKHAIKQIFWLFCEGPLLSRASAVFFTTEDECALARNAFWPYRAREHVVGYGTSDIAGDADAQIQAFRAHAGQLGARSFILFLSRIHPKKGCDELIEAFATVAGKYPDLDLVIAGPDQVGWQNELEALAERLGLKDRIHWPGMLSGDLKWGAFRACEAFVLPSHQENFGVVVAEAMAAGKPVLISNKVNIWREVAKAEAGLVENDDVAGVERMLSTFLVLSADEKIKMGSIARKAFLRRFEISTVAREIVAVLSKRHEHST